ncbi:S8 family serine peptidase [Ruminiclostridium hungatei]|uniref:S8 family serine peptidase n=1 Tax=Ruminiclostridium hungatei TaxID=48256 RepID=UPI0030EF7BB2
MGGGYIKFKNTVRIVVIDSGIDTEISDLGKYVAVSTGFRLNEEGYITEYPQMEVRYQHGTIISLIIRHICSSIELISLNILNENAATDGRILLYAMSRALDYQPDIVHMSLGTARWKYKRYIRRIAREADRRNIALVAAASNQGPESYPACVKGVFGVKGGNFSENLHYSYKSGFFYAPLNAAGVPGYGGEDLSRASGTSISAAFITGHLANIRLNTGPINNRNLKKILLENQS